MLLMRNDTSYIYKNLPFIFYLIFEVEKNKLGPIYLNVFYGENT